MRAESYFTRLIVLSIFFFFNDTATTEIYTLSLHDALPISRGGGVTAQRRPLPESAVLPHRRGAQAADRPGGRGHRPGDARGGSSRSRVRGGRSVGPPPPPPGGRGGR